MLLYLFTCCHSPVGAGSIPISQVRKEKQMSSKLLKPSNSETVTQHSSFCADPNTKTLLSSASVAELWVDHTSMSKGNGTEHLEAHLGPFHEEKPRPMSREMKGRAVRAELEQVPLRTQDWQVSAGLGEECYKNVILGLGQLLLGERANWQLA